MSSTVPADAFLTGRRSDEPLSAESVASPPRQNGELCFDAPWQGRVFATTTVLVEAGHFTWSQFQTALIVEIQGSKEDQYWSSWLEATTKIVEQLEILDDADVLQRRLELSRQIASDH